MQKITAVAFLHKGDKVFVAKRADSKKFLPGVYELPGGHIEFGESMEMGLVREMEEEFNVTVLVEDPFYTFTYLNKDKTKHTLEVVYFTRLLDDKQKIKLNPQDHSEFKWLNKEEVEELLLKQNKNEARAAIK